MNPALLSAAFACTATLMTFASVEARAAPKQALPRELATELKPVSEFDAIKNRRARSLALFEEVGKVIQHPRCLNCHPKTERPLQGDDMHVHEPPVKRGAGGMGMPAMRCITCHGPANFDPGRVPGHPRWLLAPEEMAWVGRSLGQICRQLKDPNTNGGKTMAEMVEHMAHDSLVGWGWNPGEGRTPVPGTQEEFGKIFQAWVDTGAQCPK